MMEFTAVFGVTEAVQLVQNPEIKGWVRSIVSDGRSLKYKTCWFDGREVKTLEFPASMLKSIDDRGLRKTFDFDLDIGDPVYFKQALLKPQRHRPDKIGIIIAHAVCSTENRDYLVECVDFTSVERQWFGTNTIAKYVPEDHDKE